MHDCQARKSANDRLGVRAILTQIQWVVTYWLVRSMIHALEVVLAC